MLAPGCAAATASRVPARSWPKPWGRLTTPGRIASVTESGATTDPARDAIRTRVPSARPRAAASAGDIISVQRSAPFISRG